MCGIAGFRPFLPEGFDQIKSDLVLMNKALHHRGPDNQGFWINQEHEIAFAHNRLSIIDTSEAGHQPMVSSNGRWVITYNGEIYNGAEVAKELSLKEYKGHSDTEILLEACAELGVETAVQKCAGMFAFALWDNLEKELWLVRDRVGIKPLYYAEQSGRFYFTSEIKSFLGLQSFEKRIDQISALSFLNYCCTPSASSILQGVHKLLPGHLLHVKADGKIEQKKWWSVEATQDKHQYETDDERDQHLEEMFETIIKEHMISDVPLGTFLSGGIDSSLITALMQKHSKKPVLSFSIGFKEQKFNEAIAAKETAQYLGTEHHELYVTQKDARDIIPEMAQIYDEPFADSSQIPTYILSKLARSKVTVALSGDGGDELFAGYKRYVGTQRYWRILEKAPSFIKMPLQHMIMGVPIGAWDQLGKLLPSQKRIEYFGDKVHKGANLLTATSLEDLYLRLTQQWPECGNSLKDGSLNGGEIKDLQINDFYHYLCNDILTKVDRASMATSLETRVPILDHRLVEFAFNQPESYLLKGQQGKMPLRRLLNKHIPAELFDRPKQGFGVPLDEWFRGELRDWMEDLLSIEKLKNIDFIEPSLVRQKVDEHMSGKRNWQYALWNIAMYQSWAQQWKL